MDALAANQPLTRRQILSSLTAVVVLAAAVGLAVMTASNAQLAIGVLTFSTASSDLLQRLGAVLPLGYAFAAGMAAAANPCAFGLLPGYLALYLGNSDAGARRTIVSQFFRAMMLGISVTVSFVALFGAAGLVIGAAGSLVVAALPWLSVAVGGLLVLAGARILGGGRLYVNLGAVGGTRLGRLAQRADVIGFAAYGLGFAISSLGCTLPFFLTVVGSAVTLGGPLAGFFQFVLYGCGMGAVLSAVAIATALFSSSLTRVRDVGRYLEPISAVLLLVSGGYVIYYWLTIGGLLG
jgi:cytochrome c-type biogenesis protein